MAALLATRNAAFTDEWDGFVAASVMILAYAKDKAQIRCELRLTVDDTENLFAKSVEAVNLHSDAARESKNPRPASRS